MRGPNDPGTIRDHIRRGVYVASGTTVAAALGVVLGIIGTVLPSWSVQLGWAALTLVAVVYVWSLLRGQPLPVPQHDWIIPSAWTDWGDLPFAVLFGACFGMGALTKITFIGYHVLLGLCLLSANPLMAAIAMALFGVVRTLPVFALPLQASIAGRAFDYKASVQAAYRFIKLAPALGPLEIAVLAAAAATGLAHLVGQARW